MKIRTLTPRDAAEYRDLRLRALREHPEAFATSEEEERARSSAEAAARLAPGTEQTTLGACADGQLVGIATLIRSAKPKLRHRATLAAMYVMPESRGSGVGAALLQGALKRAAEWNVTDVALAVTVGNEAARRLYVEAGFVSYGVEPRSMCVDGCFFDVEWMNLHLGTSRDPETLRT